MDTVFSSHDGAPGHASAPPDARAALGAELERLVPENLLTLGWEAFYGVHTQWLRQQAQARSVPAGAIDDLVHEVWLAVWPEVCQRCEGGETRRLRAWMSVLLRNKAVDAFRRARCRGADSLADAVAEGREPVDPCPGPEAFCERRLQDELLHAALAEMRARDEIGCRVVEMHYFQGMPFREVAAVLGLDEDDVRMQSHRMLPRLRIRLQHSLGDNFGVEGPRPMLGGGMHLGQEGKT
jgi:RNA polymerase sigma factor (sigma-70 family)